MCTRVAQSVCSKAVTDTRFEGNYTPITINFKKKKKIIKTRIIRNAVTSKGYLLGCCLLTVEKISPDAVFCCFSLSPGRDAEYRKQQLKVMFGDWEMDRNMRSILIRKTPPPPRPGSWNFGFPSLNPSLGI